MTYYAFTDAAGKEATAFETPDIEEATAYAKRYHFNVCSVQSGLYDPPVPIPDLQFAVPREERWARITEVFGEDGAPWSWKKQFGSASRRSLR